MAEFLAVLTGVFKFWDQVTWLVKTLQKTPEEKREAITAAMQKEADNFSATGRPSWDT